MARRIKNIGSHKFSDYIIVDGTLTYSNNCVVAETDPDAKSVRKIVIPHDVTEIAEDAFLACENVTSVEFKTNSSLKIGKTAFMHCNMLKHITLPQGTKEIGIGAFFANGSLVLDYLPDSIEIIDGGAFALVNVTIKALPKNIKEIRNSAFMSTNISITELPMSLQLIDVRAFEECYNLEHIDVKGATRIEDEAFKDCTGLKSVQLAETVPYIGKQAFENCSALTDIYIPGNTSIGLHAIPENCTIHCRPGSKAYMHAVSNGIEYKYI